MHKYIWMFVIIYCAPGATFASIEGPLSKNVAPLCEFGADEKAKVAIECCEAPEPREPKDPKEPKDLARLAEQTTGIEINRETSGLEERSPKQTITINSNKDTKKRQKTVVKKSQKIPSNNEYEVNATQGNKMGERLGEPSRNIECCK